jgi:hypothetical protein
VPFFWSQHYLTQDTRPPDGYALHEQRLDETEVGEGTTITLIDAKRPPEWVKDARPDAVAKWLGLAPDASGLVAWDVFDAVLTPGDIILLVSWRDHAAAEAFEGSVSLQNGARLRRVRVVRDYGMFVHINYAESSVGLLARHAIRIRINSVAAALHGH